jgi:hypothetical protein
VSQNKVPEAFEMKFPLPRNLIGAIEASADPAPHQEPLHRPNPIPTKVHQLLHKQSTREVNDGERKSPTTRRTTALREV